MSRDYTSIEKRIIDLIWFFKTIRAIWSGTKLYEFDKDEIETRKLLSPWKFNLYGVTIASLISSLIVFILGDSTNASSIFEDQNQNKKYQTILKYSYALAIPISITLSGYIYSFTTISFKGISKIKFNKNFNAYLYFDTAYTLIPNIIITVGTIYFFYLYSKFMDGLHTLLIMSDSRSLQTNFTSNSGCATTIIDNIFNHVFLILLLIFIFSLVRSIYVKFIEIPFKLIELNEKNTLSQIIIAIKSISIILLYSIFFSSFLVSYLPYLVYNVVRFFP